MSHLKMRRKKLARFSTHIRVPWVGVSLLPGVGEGKPSGWGKVGRVGERGLGNTKIDHGVTLNISCRVQAGNL